MKKLLLAAGLCFAATLHAAQTEEQAQAMFQQLLDAQPAKNYDAFVANGTLELKAALTKTQFEAAADLLNKRLAGGYDVTPLGEVDQKGYQVFLFRLQFKDKGDDILGTMSLRDGQVAGIYFK